MSAEVKHGYGETSRGLDGVDAIRTLARIRAGSREFATEEEQDTLRRWPGWGPMQGVFDRPTEAWATMYEDVAAALSDADLKLGMQGTPNAFFTPVELAGQMWLLLKQLGFAGGKVAELGCGSGVFMRTAPSVVDMVGVERDPTSAAIARLLNPRHTVIGRPLQDVTLPRDFAAVIGNVPFGRTKIFDPLAPKREGQEHSELTRTLHHYFTWRALQCLAPGGLAVLLISRYFMDGLDDEMRAPLAELADFIGAVRLPNGALEGGTDALADIVVFRRKVPGEDVVGESWRSIQRDKLGDDINVNAYWAQRPGMVLGTMRPGRTGAYGLNLEVDPVAGESVADGVARVLPGLVADAAERGLVWRKPVDAAEFTSDAEGFMVEDGWLENSFHERDGRIYVVKDVGKVYTVDEKTGRRKRDKTALPKLVASPVPNPGKQLTALVRMRDMAEKLLDAEADHSKSDAEVDALRTPLRRAYRAFVNKHGWLRQGTTYSKGVDPETGVEQFGRRVPAFGGFRHDPGAALVFALELWDDDEQTGAMAPILSERQNRPVVLPTTTDDPATALAWSLDRKGSVDLDYIAALLGVAYGDRGRLTEQLGDRIFQEPGYDTWLPAEEYLSGDVRAKLAAAETAALVEPRFARNVEALKRVQPKWLAPGEIMASLGTPWVPASDIERFCIDLFGYGCGADVRHLKDSNRWDVEPKGGRSSTAAAETWGTPDVDGYKLIELALNGKSPEVRVRVSKTSTKKDEQRSLAAAEMQQRIKSRFSEWIWEDAERAERLSTLYNTRYNCLVTRKFNGDHITIAGLAPFWASRLYGHQREFIARSIATPATLCGHPVGAGKTATMTCTAMKLSELGLATKPMLVVPNHLIEQADAAARQMFPGKKILSANSESISKSRRAFTARVATQHWDLIIITHSAFDVMPVHPATEVAYLEESKARLHASLLDAAPDGKLKGRQVKAMARKLDNLEADIKTLQRRVHEDSGCTFEQLGVSWIGIDEAHNYANLSVPCYNDGFTISASKRASHLDMIMRWLSRRGQGRYASLFTGTPIKNTMLQFYVMKQYLMPEYLESVELGSADAWVASYVEMVTKVGVTIDGGKFELQTKPARFINAPELRVMFSMVADIRTADDLGLKRPAEIAKVIKVQPTAKQALYSQILVSRAAALKGVRFPEEGADNMLKVCNDGRWSATDPALVGIYDNEPGKLHAAAEQIIKIWREFPDELQLVFCDVGTPNDKKGSQTYGRLRKLLVEMGMPAGLVEFAHTAKSDAEKASQFKRARTGKMLVLMGSTGKMGTGTNVQDRVKAMHHLDAPFTPAAVDQRDGRGLRPGNRNDEVFNYRYVTARTFDAYLWQLLVRKQGFISQMMTGSLDRSIEDCDTEQLLSFAAVQASATDQPLLMEREDVAAELSRLRSGQASHRQMQQRQRLAIPMLRQRIAERKAEQAAWAAIAKAQVPELTEEVGKALHAMLDGYSYRRPSMKFGGITISIGSWTTSANQQKEPELRVDGGAGYMTEKLYASFKAETILKRLAELLAKADNGAADVTGNLIAGLETELAEKERLLTVPFDKEGELLVKQARLDQLDAELKQQASNAEDADAAVVDGDEDQGDPAGPVKLTEAEKQLLAEIESGAGTVLDNKVVWDSGAVTPLTAPVRTAKPKLAYDPLTDGPTLAETMAELAAAFDAGPVPAEPVAEPVPAAVADDMARMFGEMIEDHEAKYRQEMAGLAALVGF
jgi:N12 class adenine-specific DNA methylase